jgi:hypothetical protein
MFVKVIALVEPVPSSISQDFDPASSGNRAERHFNSARAVYGKDANARG